MRAICLSGGSAKGAAQLGALQYLIRERKFKYNIFCGISVGALNASMLSMYPEEEDLQGIDALEKIWLNISNDKVYKRWFPFGIFHSLWLNSAYNSQPLINLVRQGLNLDKIRASGKQVSVGAVSLTTGKYRNFTQNDDCFVDAVLASASFPGALKPIEIENELYTDGGVQHITNLSEAIKMGADEIDLILCAPEKTTATYDKNSNAISLALRSIDIMTDELINADLKQAQLYNQIALLNPNSGKRYVKINVIRPDKNLTEDSLDFSHDKIVEMMKIGYETAKKVIF